MRYPRNVTFDHRVIEAKLAAGAIAPEKMPALAWDALEAGYDGPAIIRVAGLVNPSGWEIDQILPEFMAECGLQFISVQEASIRLAQQLAFRILSEGLDPLQYLRSFALLWFQSDYAHVLQDVGTLDDEQVMSDYSEVQLRQYAHDVLQDFSLSKLSSC